MREVLIRSAPSRSRRGPAPCPVAWTATRSPARARRARPRPRPPRRRRAWRPPRGAGRPRGSRRGGRRPSPGRPASPRRGRRRGVSGFGAHRAVLGRVRGAAGDDARLRRSAAGNPGGPRRSRAGAPRARPAPPPPGRRPGAASSRRRRRARAHVAVRGHEPPRQLGVDLGALPGDVLGVLGPLQVADDHAAGVGEDVRAPPARPRSPRTRSASGVVGPVRALDDHAGAHPVRRCRRAARRRPPPAPGSRSRSRAAPRWRSGSTPCPRGPRRRRAPGAPARRRRGRRGSAPRRAASLDRHDPAAQPREGGGRVAADVAEALDRDPRAPQRHARSRPRPRGSTIATPSPVASTRPTVPAQLAPACP